MNESGSYDRISKVTETEDVSYVCSPYLPRILLAEPDREMRSNADRALEATQGTATLLDTLDEIISMDHVTVVVGEWIPFGMNLVRQLNDKLGSSERVQGGVFSAEVARSDPPSRTLALRP